MQLSVWPSMKIALLHLKFIFKLQQQHCITVTMIAFGFFYIKTEFTKKMEAQKACCECLPCEATNI